MNKKISKTEAKEKIDEFFFDIKNKNPKEIKKIKKLAMRFNIKLGDKKKKFCKHCLAPYNNSKVRIKKKYKLIGCNTCGKVTKWKLV